LNWASIANSVPSGTFNNVSEPIDGGSLGYWEVNANPWDGPGVRLVFGSALTTAVYTTTTNTSPAPGQVFVSFYQNTIYGALNAGAQVYVKKLGPGTFEINICDAPWDYNGSQYYLKCRLVSPS